MLNAEESDIDENIEYVNYQEEIDSSDLEQMAGLNNNNNNNTNNSEYYYYHYGSDVIKEKYYNQDDFNGVVKSNSGYELNDNEISLEMYFKELDTISLSKGIVENIWYVELESNGEIVWSSVIACDLLKHENDRDDNDENRVWESLSSKSGWNKKLLFGNDINVITKKKLYELLIKDGITNEASIKLFTSIGMWKSLFLTLNYSTYIRKRREMLYSKQVKNYIIKFNKRKETMERRMQINYDEDDRKSLIKLIYQGIQSLFESVSICNNPEIFKITYKIPFYWPSLIANIYVFEKLGNYELMLIIIEYISEINPELIFEFQKYSKSINSNNNIIEMLNIFNNELLQNTSICFQEYLSDLLSITEKSKLILSSYIATSNDTEKQQSSLKIEEDQSIKLQHKNEDDKNIAKTYKQGDSKKEPNYMRPTRLSEIRKQNSRRSITERIHSKFDDEDVNISNINGNNNNNNNNNCGSNNSDNTASGQVKANIQKYQEKDMKKNNENNHLSFTNDQNRKSRIGTFNTRSSRNSTDSKENDEMLDNHVSNNANSNNNNNISKNPTKINTNKSINNDSYDENKLIHEKNNLKSILNLLEEKSKSQNINKVNFDDELFNIISELDKINFNNGNTTNDISTNISEDLSHSIIDSNHNFENDKDLKRETSPKNYDDFKDLDYQDDNNNSNNNDETYLQLNNVKSPLDPYDWYYLSSNNENGDNENIQITNNLNKLSPKGIYINNEKITKLISLNENGNNTKNVVLEEGASSTSNTEINELKYIESILDKEIEELQRQESELASNIYF
ncbi:asparagine-rich [Cryptosporidium sp. chipmunk genotype I]|uniref:asparagine-rich n=1 Tax=Cryptosporidium sp. chipmunk genotype I TaxID=1280935 RepID=UPI00351A34B7|nr:asparagine-rich [Cryptosporidium sp. chipmunk genotype I]